MASVDKQRIKILIESEVQELYSAPIFNESDQMFFFDMDEKEQRACDTYKTYEAKLYFVLLLGYFRRKPLMLEALPRQFRSDLTFIAGKYFNGKTVPRKNMSALVKSRIYAKVIQVCGFSKFSTIERQNATKFATQIASYSAEPRYILDELIAYFSHHKISLPAYSSLQLLIGTVLKTQNVKSTVALRSVLSSSLSAKLNKILTSEESTTLLSSIKKLPRDFTNKEMSKEIEVFNFIQEIYPEIVKAMELLALSKSNIEYYASLIDYYSVAKIKRFDADIASLYLVCYLYQRYVNITECFTSAFIYHVDKITNEADIYGKAKAHEHLSGMQAKIEKMSPVIKILIDKCINENTSLKDIREKIYQIMPEADLSLMSDYFATMSVDRKKYEWEFIDSNASRIKKSLRAIFVCLTFTDRDGHTNNYNVIKKAQMELSARGELSEFDLQFIKRNIRPYIKNNQERPDGMNFDRAEWWMYTKVVSLIKNRQFNIKNSITYKKFEDNLLNDKRWKDKETLLDNCNLPSMKMDPELLIAQKIQLLKEKLGAASQRLTGGENETVIYSDREGKAKWIVKQRAAAPDVNNPFFERMSQTHIGDLLEFVQRETNFASAFTHIRENRSKEKLNLSNVIACIVANGTRFGIFQMSRLCNIAYDQLNLTQKSYLRMETLQNANDLISNAIATLPIFAYYNIQKDVLHASMDGQKFESRVSTIRARYSSKYLGKGKGLSALSLSANHVPVNAKMMALNEHESHHLFDLLYNNNSDIQPDVLSTDNHGTNQCNFALLDLSGWQFAPRYARVGKVLNDLFIVTKDGQLQLRHAIKTKTILDGWDLVQRIMLSLHTKELSQATIGKQLSSSKTNSKIFQALIEYDRLIKTIYMVDYLDSEELRDYVQRALNRGEAYHQLQRRIEGVNGNKFRGRTDEEINIWYECARLLSNAIIYFNSCVLSKLLLNYERIGNKAMTEQIKTFSPVAWTNINLNGSYSFSTRGADLNLDDLILDMMSRLPAEE